MVERLTGIFLAFILGWSAGQARAEEALPDPTRPAPEASMTAGVPASGPVLQSVMIAPGRRTAVIGGQLLAEGDNFGDAKLVRISEGEVVLSGPGGQQKLKLFPGVEKTLILAPQAVAPGTAPKRAKHKSNRNIERKVP